MTGFEPETSRLVCYSVIATDIFLGKICIDNKNIDDIALSRLRTSLSTIPQDPSIFSETVRKNLDPKGNYEDEKLWQILEKVQLKPVFEATIEKLDYKLAEEGANERFKIMNILKKIFFIIKF